VSLLRSKKSRRRALAANATLAVVSVVLVLVALEAVVRFLGGEQPMQVTRLFQPDARLGWAPIPNLHAVARGSGQGILVATNSEGIRGPEFSPTPQPGVFRIILLGDSITFGFGVQQAETFAAQLEGLLERRKRIEVLNAGCYGYGLGQYLIRYERLAKRYRHDAALVCLYIGNDLENTMMVSCYGKKKPAFILQGHRLRLVNSPITNFNEARDRFSAMFASLNRLFLPAAPLTAQPRGGAGVLARYFEFLTEHSALARLVASRVGAGVGSAAAEGVQGRGKAARIGWIADHFYVYDGGWKYTKDWNEAQRRVLDLLGALLDRFKAEAPRVAVVLIPARAQLDPEWTAEYIEAAERIGLAGDSFDFALPNRLIASVCKRGGIDCIDLLPVLAGRGNPTKLFLPENPHYSPVGHRLIAEAIAGGLLKLGWFAHKKG